MKLCGTVSCEYWNFACVSIPPSPPRKHIWSNILQYRHLRCDRPRRRYDRLDTNNTMGAHSWNPYLIFCRHGAGKSEVRKDLVRRNRNWARLVPAMKCISIGHLVQADSDSNDLCDLPWFSLRHRRLLHSLKWLRREYEASPEYKAQERRSRRQNVVSSISIDAPNMDKGTNINAGRNNVFDRYIPIMERGWAED